MFDADNSTRLAVAGVVLLIGLGCIIAWLPAVRRDPAGLPARLFVTAGLIMAIADLGGLGSVLGFSLAAMGGLVAWEGQPAPEIPRPHRGGLVVAAVLSGLAALAAFEGWGPLDRVPDELRPVATLVVAVTGTLATLAIADRARVSLREAIRRRFTTRRPTASTSPAEPAPPQTAAPAEPAPPQTAAPAEPAPPQTAARPAAPLPIPADPVRPSTPPPPPSPPAA